MKTKPLIISKCLCILLMLFVVSSCFKELKYVIIDDDWNVTYQDNKYLLLPLQPAHFFEIGDNMVEIDSYRTLIGGGTYYADESDNPKLIIDSHGDFLLREDIDFSSFEFQLYASTNYNEVWKEYEFGTSSFNNIIGEEESYDIAYYDYKCGEIQIKGFYINDYIGWYSIIKMNDIYYIKTGRSFYRIKKDFVPILEEYLIWYDKVTDINYHGE